MTATASLEIESSNAPIPTPEDLIDHARGMVDKLKGRARQCVEGRDVPAETIADMQEAGFFRILQPRRFGGYEMHPNVFFDVQKRLAEGCMSTGWMYGVLGCHPYELALFDDRAQQEVWGEDSATLASSSYQPVGKVTRVEGGFRLSGHWGFSTGSIHCNWVLLGALVPPEEEGGPPDMRTFLVPRSDYTIDRDAWHVFGLQGTGSHDIIVNDVFVPEYRTHRAIEGFLCQNPGQEVNTAALYQLPWAQIFVRSVSTSCLGGLRSAVNAAMKIMESQISTNTGKASSADPFLHSAISKAHAQGLEMENTLRTSFNELMELSERGDDIPLERRALFAYNSSTIARRCATLVDDMVQLLGGRAVYKSSEIIQPWLDINAARAHVANDPNNRTLDVIGTQLGQAPAFTFM